MCIEAFKEVLAWAVNKHFSLVIANLILLKAIITLIYQRIRKLTKIILYMLLCGPCSYHVMHYCVFYILYFSYVNHGTMKYIGVATYTYLLK